MPYFVPTAGSRRARIAAGLTLASCALAGVAGAHTFAVDYIVTIAAANPKIALIRWEFSGIDEISDLALRFPAERFDAFDGTGTRSNKWRVGGSVSFSGDTSEAGNHRNSVMSFSRSTAP